MGFEQTITSITYTGEDVALLRQIGIDCANKYGDIRVSLLKELNPFL
jgi:hypothetical protein